MNLRVLDPEEHGKTRKLWENVFTEDTKAFLDYYYFIKTRDNRISVVEEDGEIVSMLQQNPYRIRVEGKAFPSAYIIAVATQKEYRGRGYMRELLCRALAEMYDQKIPFTFLMPAAEAIYTPYDFRFIYDQRIGKISETALSGKECGFDGQFREQDAGLWDAQEMADFFQENFAGKWQVCTERDAGYYQTMILEQQSERGGVRLLRKDGRIIAMAAYAREDGTEIREPLCMDGYEDFLHKMMLHCAGEDNTDRKEIRVYADLTDPHTEKKPVIMARIVNLPVFLSALKVPAGTRAECSFAVIDPVLKQNSRIWKLESGAEEEEVHVRETEDSDGVLSIADLTEFVFGRTEIGEIKKREGVILSERLEVELGKIRKLESIFLNEVV